MKNDPIGPTAYENFHAKNDCQPIVIHEYPLYSDTVVAGECVVGPYTFLNALTSREPGIVGTASVLRLAWYWTPPDPTFLKTDAERFHGSTPADELAALVSLSLGIRLRAGNIERQFVLGDDPLGRPRNVKVRPVPVLIKSATDRWIIAPPTERPNLVEIPTTLGAYVELSPETAVTALRAARLHQDALWLAESEPHLSWLMLVSALETCAAKWNGEELTPEEKFKDAYGELHDYLDNLNPHAPSRVAQAFKHSFGITRQFVDFTLTFRPDPPLQRPTAMKLEWASSSFEKAIRQVYAYRSRSLHEGQPFPAPLCAPPIRFGENDQVAEVPGGHTAVGGGTWLEKDLPMHLHMFAHITRGTIVNWLESQRSSSASRVTS
jgi:hypothetical protein